MLINTLKPFFRRDLHKLKEEIESYRQEEKIWLVENGISNSAGNLCLHIIGNIQFFIGATLGNSGYVRQRELEFSQRGIPRTKLLEMIEDTLKVVENSLDQLKEEQLQEELPVVIGNQKQTTETLLIQIMVHLGYHLGQINYHRRLLDV